MTVKIDGTNTEANPAFTGADTDTGLQCGTNELKLVTGGAARATVDSSGNVGIGSSTINQTSSNRTVLGINGTNNALLNFNHGDTLAGFMYAANDEFRMEASGTRPLIFRGNSSEQMRIDSSGRLLVGTTSSITSNTYAKASFIDSVGAEIHFGRNDSDVTSGNSLGGIRFYGNDGGSYQECARISAQADGTHANNDKPSRLVFFTTADNDSSPIERIRIKNDGNTLMRSSTSNGVLNLNSAQSASESSNALVVQHSATSITGGTASCIIFTNGNIKNSNNFYGSLSDAKLKENIVDASSQWDDIKAIQVRNYNFKESTGQQTHRQLGVVAQELEAVSPGLVSDSPDRDEEGNDLGTVTKSVNYSVLYMKSVKALQEAMTRIETLETQYTDLLARVTALEAAE